MKARRAAGGVQPPSLPALRAFVVGQWSAPGLGSPGSCLASLSGLGERKPEA
ncbi:MAG: hypothetical protein NXI32_27920 [bacterium]|nr:hypothetical protein [bacterium]